ncbi:unnamed protein product [Prorocentrum cordatum]|uniref:Smr domain-containing protein n=1 Tax=Prorocentrum cordatum TaxID=2364126 RepID=A0ABN9VPJ8_9DINO|nr:unnamed protein product [Polarella glacialis]
MAPTSADTRDAAALVDLIRERLAFKAMPASALAGAAMAGPGPQPTGQPRKRQKCALLPWFFLQRDWGWLVSAELSVAAKISLVAHRMWPLGIVRPSEGFRKQGVAIVICRDTALANVIGSERRRLALRLKDAVRGAAKPRTHGRALACPRVPEMPSIPVRAFACDADQPVPPPQSVLEIYDSVLRGVCIRAASGHVAGDSAGCSSHSQVGLGAQARSVRSVAQQAFGAQMQLMAAQFPIDVSRGVAIPLRAAAAGASGRVDEQPLSRPRALADGAVESHGSLAAATGTATPATAASGSAAGALAELEAHVAVAASGAAAASKAKVEEKAQEKASGEVMGKAAGTMVAPTRGKPAAESGNAPGGDLMLLHLRGDALARVARPASSGAANATEGASASASTVRASSSGAQWRGLGGVVDCVSHPGKERKIDVARAAVGYAFSASDIDQAPQTVEDAAKWIAAASVAEARAGGVAAAGFVVGFVPAAGPPVAPVVLPLPLDLASAAALWAANFASRGDHPNAVAYSVAIDALSQGGQWMAAVALFARMRASGLAPDLVAYSAVISACHGGNQWKFACALLEAMRKDAVLPNVVSYSAAISTCKSAHEWAWALALLQEMQLHGVRPNDVALATAAHACQNAGQHALAEQLFRKMSGPLLSEAPAAAAREPPAAAPAAPRTPPAAPGPPSAASVSRPPGPPGPPPEGAAPAPPGPPPAAAAAPRPPGLPPAAAAPGPSAARAQEVAPTPPSPAALPAPAGPPVAEAAAIGDSSTASGPLSYRRLENGNALMDLHGLPVEVAKIAVQVALEDLLLSSFSGEEIGDLIIITGVGKHSPGGVAMVRPAVIEFLRDSLCISGRTRRATARAGCACQRRS